jgi:energy-coupling factor transport system substrate-specific component
VTRSDGRGGVVRARVDDRALGHRRGHARRSDVRVRPVRVGPRAALALTVASALGLAAFTWPLLVDPGAALESTGAPLVLALLLPLVLAVVLAEVSEGGLDAKALAVLGVLSAIGAALRPLGAGTAGVETVFFLIVLAGRVLGPGFGFVLGTTTLFASALLTGGVGPWLPFQMLAAAWVGLGAGLLPPARGRWELALLAGYAAAASLLFGALMNLTFWPFTLGPGTQLSFDASAGLVENLRAFGLFTLATSLGWDVGRALTTVVLVLLAGPAVLAALRRAARRASFDAAAEFHPPTGEGVGRRAGGS